MNFDYSEKVQKLVSRLEAFMDELVYPNERMFEEQLEAAESRWTVPWIMEELKGEARAAGLWNLFLPESEYGAGLTNLEYAPLCEVMGRSPIAPRSSTATRPTRAIWRSWFATGPRSRKTLARAIAER